MDPESRLRERLSLELRHAMPGYAQQKGWVEHIAKHTGISPRRVQAHMDRESRCSAVDMFAYCEFFGDGFERQVRGPKS